MLVSALTFKSNNNVPGAPSIVGVNINSKLPALTVKPLGTFGATAVNVNAVGAEINKLFLAKTSAK